ncbi:MAG: trimeric intracellular cation channel family protein, partial [Sphingomonadaceae bacterium]|nr:trimeric intracellular cation channel family protein [Sphingomonadaceae bacterium]
LYVTAAALSAAICAAGAMLSAPRELVWTLAVAAGFALRASAIRFGIHLPSYKRADV